MAPFTLCCDTGIDDAIALATAAGLALDVPKVVAVAGNVALPDVAENTARVLALAGLQAEVVLGPAVPLGEEGHRSDRFHGSDGLGGTRSLLPNAELPVQEGLPSGAVVATGPLTAVALALAEGLPVGPLVWMGGAVRRAGNVTRHAEFNAWWDARATAIVLDALPLRMLPLDVTTTLVLRDDHIERLAAGQGHTARWCARAARFIVESRGPVYLHDPAAVVASTRPDLFSWEAVTLAGVPDGDERGATRVVAEGGPHEVAMHADVDAVVETILGAVLACP
jgi:inosine-uridine nucleoside N-ribohydrolase